MHEIKLRKCPRVHGLRYTPDGRQLIAVGGAETHFVDTAVWLDPTGGMIRRLDFLAQCCDFTPDCTRFAIAFGPWDASDVPNMVRWCDVSPDGPGPWVLLDGPWVTAQARWGRFDSGIGPTGVSFSHDGGTLLVGYFSRPRANDWVSHLAECRFGRKGPLDVSEATVPPEVSLSVFACGPGGTLAASGGLDYDAAIWVRRPGQPFVAWFEPPGTKTRRLLFAPDRPVLAVANGRQVFLLAPDQAEPLATLTGYPKQVNDLAFAPDGKHLLTAGHDGAVRVWDAATGAAGPVFAWDIGPLTAVAVAPDGLTAATAGSKARVVVWDLDF
jgi:hypothetical protein